MPYEQSTLASARSPEMTTREAVQALAQMVDQALKDLATQAKINGALVSRILKLEADLKETCNGLVAVAEPLKSHLANHPVSSLLHPAAELRMWRSVREQLLALHRQSGLLSDPSPPIPSAPPGPGPLKSRLCSQDQFETPWYGYWWSRIKEPAQWQRKQWEWCYIAQALHERGVLKPGSRGLGFGVGEEPLTAVFASRGCSILATDLDQSDPKSRVWAATRQHAPAIATLNQRGICDPEDFKRLVSHRPADMNAISPDLTGFDFVWSSSSLDHLGTLQKAAQFIVNSLACLKPGGLAVHTTEFNVASNQQTITEGETVVFRQQDIETLARALRQNGHEIELDWTLGNGIADNLVDIFPYDYKVYLRLQLHQYVITSIGLIIKKAG
ncbi:MAG: class I SAM-dependent methyltransferase [Terriglobia bacterium]